MTASDSSHPPLTERTAFLANKVGQLLMEEIERGLNAEGLSGRTYFVLTTVEREVPRSQQELAAMAMVDATTMGVLIDNLEAQGLVERSRNRSDRRRYDLTLSEKGMATRDAATDALAATEQEFFSPLDNDQRESIHALLQLLLVDRWPPPQ